MSRIDATQLTPLLATISDWQYAPDRGGLIRREFVFADFAAAFGFMAQMALVSERANHHPEWSNVYQRVNVTLTTHDAGGLSMKDVEWARQADQARTAYGG